MIITFIIYTLNILLSVIVFILPSFNIIPAQVFSGISFFIDKLVDLNSMFLIIDNLLIATLFLIKFFVYYLTYKIIIKLVNIIRGAEGLH